MGTNGKPLKEKVKLLDKDVYQNLLSDPDTKDAAAYIRQEVRKVTRELGISPNSDNYNLYARKIAYDVLNSASKPKTTYKELVEQKAAPTVINVKTSGVSGSGSGTGAEYLKVYDDIKKRADENQRTGTKPLIVFDKNKREKVRVEGFVPVNSLNNTQQNVVMSAVWSKGEVYQPYGIGDVFIRNTGDGKLGIWDINSNELITILDKEGTDVQANKPLGQKAKQGALKEARSGGSPAAQNPPAASKLAKGSLDNVGRK